MKTQDEVFQISRNIKDEIASKIDFMFFDISDIQTYNYHSVELMNLVMRFIENQKHIVSIKEISSNCGSAATTGIPITTSEYNEYISNSKPNLYNSENK